MPICSKRSCPFTEENTSKKSKEVADSEFDNDPDVIELTSLNILDHLKRKGCGTYAGGLVIVNRVSIIITASNARHVAHAFVFLLKGCTLILYENGRYTIFGQPRPGRPVLFQKVEYHVSS